MSVVLLFVMQYARNYVTSELPVGEPLATLRSNEDAERVSAGEVCTVLSVPLPPLSQLSILAARLEIHACKRQ